MMSGIEKYISGGIDKRFPECIVLIGIYLHTAIVKYAYRRKNGKSVPVMESLKRPRQRDVIIDTVTIRITIGAYIAIA